MKKPIRVFYSDFSGEFWASQHYRVEGKNIVITGKKFNVTSDIGSAVTKHKITFKKVKNGKSA